jgi:hypothetical protein
MSHIESNGFVFQMYELLDQEVKITFSKSSDTRYRVALMDPLSGETTASSGSTLNEAYLSAKQFYLFNQKGKQQCPTEDTGSPQKEKPSTSPGVSTQT